MTTKEERKRKRRAEKRKKKQEHAAHDSPVLKQTEQHHIDSFGECGTRGDHGIVASTSSNGATGSAEGSGMGTNGGRKKGKKRQRQTPDSKPSFGDTSSPQLPTPPSGVAANHSAETTAAMERNPPRGKKKKVRQLNSSAPSEKNERGVAAAAAAAGGEAAAAISKSPSSPCFETKPRQPQQQRVGKVETAGLSSGGRPTQPRGDAANGASAAGKSGVTAATGKTKGSSPGGSKLSALQQRMRQKLEGAQFRMINETLYTSESKVSLDKFSNEPELFDVVSVNGMGVVYMGVGR